MELNISIDENGYASVDKCDGDIITPVAGYPYRMWYMMVSDVREIVDNERNQ